MFHESKSYIRLTYQLPPSVHLKLIYCNKGIFVEIDDTMEPFSRMSILSRNIRRMLVSDGVYAVCL